MFNLCLLFNLVYVNITFLFNRFQTTYIVCQHCLKLNERNIYSKYLNKNYISRYNFTQKILMFVVNYRACQYTLEK